MLKLLNQKSEIKNLKSETGFSIVEVLVVFFLISMGLVGLLALVEQNIRVQSFNKNTLVASQLAQEGFELVRAVRDKNWIKRDEGLPVNWYDGVGAADSSKNFVIYLDKLNNDIFIQDISDFSAAMTILKSDSDGFYVHDNTLISNTIFKRMITTTHNSAEDSLEVTSEVRWQEKGVEKNYAISGTLYNWY